MKKLNLLLIIFCTLNLHSQKQISISKNSKNSYRQLISLRGLATECNNIGKNKYEVKWTKGNGLISGYNLLIVTSSGNIRLKQMKNVESKVIFSRSNIISVNVVAAAILPTPEATVSVVDIDIIKLGSSTDIDLSNSCVLNSSNLTNATQVIQFLSTYSSNCGYKNFRINFYKNSFTCLTDFQNNPLRINMDYELDNNGTTMIDIKEDIKNSLELEQEDGINANYVIIQRKKCICSTSTF